jgi:gluconate 2-dehydrogenase gamma chain
MFPGSTSIASLTAEQQLKLAEAIEKTEFFRLVRTHTILGFLGHPMHGGNRGEAGWKLIGFPNAMHHQPPFGYYDEEPARGGGS